MLDLEKNDLITQNRELINQVKILNDSDPNNMDNEAMDINKNLQKEIQNLKDENKLLQNKLKDKENERLKIEEEIKQRQLEEDLLRQKLEKENI